MDSPTTPWFLLVASLVIPRNKDFIKQLFLKQPTPWLLLFMSWAFFLYGPPDSSAAGIWKKILKITGLSSGSGQRRYTAKFSGTTVTRSPNRITGATKIERVPAVGEAVGSQDTLRKKSLAEMSVQEILSDLDPSPLPPLSNRFAAQLTQARALLHRVFPLKDGWDTLKETDGIIISNLHVEGLDLPFIRGDGIIPGPFTVLEVLSVIQNAFARKVWDPRFDTSEVLEYVDSNSFLIHSVQKGTFPVAARDFLTATNFYFKDDGLFKSIDYVAASVLDSLGPAPDSQGRVRASILLAGWRLEAKKEGIAATYLVHVDVKGSVPSALIKQVQMQTPLAIKRIDSYLQELGPLPFLLSGPFSPHPKLLFSKRDYTDCLVAMTYTVSPDVYAAPGGISDVKQAAITIALPGRTFKGGASVICKGRNITFQGCLIKTELVSSATCFVFQLYPAVIAPEVIEVSINITPSNTGVVKLNGVELADQAQ